MEVCPAMAIAGGKRLDTAGVTGSPEMIIFGQGKKRGIIHGASLVVICVNYYGRNSVDRSSAVLFYLCEIYY